MKHYTVSVMVTLIGCAANTNEVYCFIKERMIDVKPKKVVWVALITCCGAKNDFELVLITSTQQYKI